MDGKLYELDGLTASLIADNLVCPFVPDCRFSRIADQPNHNSLYYATHYCGDRYRNCQVYITRTGEPKSGSRPNSPESHRAENNPEGYKN
jgi:hypothetical protein